MRSALNCKVEEPKDNKQGKYQFPNLLQKQQNHVNAVNYADTECSPRYDFRMELKCLCVMLALANETMNGEPNQIKTQQLAIVTQCETT